MGRRPKGSKIRLKSNFIEDILDEMRIDKKELAARAKISYQYMIDLMGENPRSVPSRKKVRQIAAVLNKKPYEIAEGIEPSSYVSPVQSDIPLARESISDRFIFVPPYSVDVEGMERYAFRSSWLEQKGDPRDMVIIQVTGDSMEPTMYEGDSVLVDQGKKAITSGKIYAFKSNDEIFVKRLRRIGGSRIEVRSDNHKFHPPYEIDLEIGGVTIIGQVIWIGREVER